MERSEYHHYVPRFILRNYRVSKLPNKNKNKGRHKNKATQSSQHVPDKDLKDGLIRQIDIKAKQLVEVRLSRTFGMNDMYSHTSSQANAPNDVEKRLSSLESRAGEIIAGVRSDFESGKPSTTLKRAGKDILRKFLFIMHYRNKTFHSRFKKSKDEYDENDRQLMMEFMAREKLDEPIHVWYRNIRAILEADLDEFPSFFSDASRLARKFRAYEPDMKWFLKNIQAHYLVFVQPTSPKLEFLLTENAFSVFEGPVSGDAWTDFHLISPMSPKLLILARSALLGTGYDENTEGLRVMRELTTITHYDPKAAYESVLGDLPVHQANNNYSRVVNGKREPLPTRIGRDKHEFYFPFFQISDRDVGFINTILLENAFRTGAIIYREPVALRTALEFYLGLDSKGFKVVAAKEEHGADEHIVLKQQSQCTDTLSLEYLETLETMARRLGSDAIVQHVAPAYTGQVLFPPLRGDTERRYKYLARLWIKVDALMQHQPPAQKDKIRLTRRGFIAAEIPTRRIWLLLKNLKELSRQDPETFVDFVGTGLEIAGVEDTLADMYQVFEPPGLGRLMQAASQLEDFRKRNPNFGLEDSEFSFDETGIRKLQEEVGTTFACGNIEECGIPSMRYKAHAIRPLLTLLLPGLLQENPIYRSIMKEEQNLEILTRHAVARDFSDLDLRLSPIQKGRLRKALFKMCFPLKIPNH